MYDTIPIRRCKASLKMPRRLGDKLIKARSIAAMLTGNTWFPLPWSNDTVLLTKLNTDIQALSDAETVVKTGLKEGVALRNAALAIVMADLRSILYMVQATADSNSKHATEIIEGAGYAVKQLKGRQKMQNNAFNTEIAGTVMLTADTSRGHEWQMSKDQNTIIKLPATNTARTFVTGLTPADVWYFRNRKINTKKLTFNWCPWIKLTIGTGGKTLGGGNISTGAGSINNT